MNDSMDTDGARMTIPSAAATTLTSVSTTLPVPDPTMSVHWQRQELFDRVIQALNQVKEKAVTYRRTLAMAKGLPLPPEYRDEPSPVQAAPSSSSVAFRTGVDQGGSNHGSHGVGLGLEIEVGPQDEKTGNGKHHDPHQPQEPPPRGRKRKQPVIDKQDTTATTTTTIMSSGGDGDRDVKPGPGLAQGLGRGGGGFGYGLLEDRLRHSAVSITSDTTVKVVPVYTFLIAVCDAWTALPEELKGRSSSLLLLFFFMMILVELIYVVVVVIDDFNLL